MEEIKKLRAALKQSNAAINNPWGWRLITLAMEATKDGEVSLAGEVEEALVMLGKGYHLPQGVSKVMLMQMGIQDYHYKPYKHRELSHTLV
jgi:hypothetical protein